MSRKKLYAIRMVIFVALLCILLSSCNRGNPTTPAEQEEGTPYSESGSVSPEPDSAAEWTLLIYMCGSDLESRKGEASSNLTEMLSVTDTDHLNLIVQTGGAKKWNIQGISPSSTDRYQIHNGEMILLERNIIRQNFGDSQTLTDFVKFGLEKFPARHTALILWDHGGGPLKGICFDENFNHDALTLPELETSLSNAGITKKFDFIGFDACLMANYETAYTVKPYAENMIASEEKESSGGWDYRTVIEHLGKDDFYSSLLSSYAKKTTKKEYYTLSHIDLTKLDTITNAFSELLVKMQEETKRKAITAINEALAFGNKNSDLYDLGNLFAAYGVSCNIADVVTYTSGSLRTAGTGLSIWFPLMSGDSLNEYFPCNPYEPYSMFLSAFYREADKEKIQFLNYAQISENRLSFTLNTSSMEYVGWVDYDLYQSTEPDFFMAIGNDNDVIIDENTVIVDFKGNWVTFNGQWLYCTINDRIGMDTIYEAPIMVDDCWGNLLFSYHSETTDIRILGVTYDGDSDGISEGRIYDIEEGSIIRIMQRTETDSGYTDEYPEDTEFVYHRETSAVKVEKLPDGDYQYSAFVTDVFGKRYLAGTAVVKIVDGVVKIETITSDEVVYPK